MCFQSNNIKMVYEEFTEYGIKFVGPPVEITAGRNTGGYAIYFDGPDGIPFELFQPPPV